VPEIKKIDDAALPKSNQDYSTWGRIFGGDFAHPGSLRSEN